MITSEYIKTKIIEFKPFITEACKEKNIFSQIFDLIMHKIKINTSPFDYYRYKFYRSKLNWSEKARFIGKRGSRYFPWELNATKFVPLFDNKLLFKVMLDGFGLPQPGLIATIGKHYELNNRENFITVINSIGKDFLFKPIEGSGGRGVIFIDVEGNDFYIDGNERSSEDLWEQVQSDDYLIEYRVRQVAELSRIYPKSLNTFRVITIRNNLGKFSIANCYLKIGSDGRRVDNSGVGGITIYMNSEGKPFYPFSWLKGKEISRHPDTNYPLKEIVVSDFKKVLDLAIDAAKNFSFVGAVGWDIALTDRGPMIIEGNIFFDAKYNQIGPKGGLINDELAKSLKKRSMWTRWEKTMIHPRVNRKKIRA